MIEQILRNLIAQHGLVAVMEALTKVIAHNEAQMKMIKELNQ